MAYRDVADSIGTINTELRSRYEEGDPYMVQMGGRPKLHVISFDPLAYETYGFLANRAPRFVGTMALRQFLTRPHANGGASVYAGVEVGSQGYAYALDGYNTEHVDFLNGVVSGLGFAKGSFRTP